MWHYDVGSIRMQGSKQHGSMEKIHNGKVQQNRHVTQPPGEASAHAVSHDHSTQPDTLDSSWLEKKKSVAGQLRTLQDKMQAVVNQPKQEISMAGPAIHKTASAAGSEHKISDSSAYRDFESTATLNGIMVTAALVATVTFAAMVMPPGGLVPPPSGAAGGSRAEDDIGHVVLRVAGHSGFAVPLVVFLYLSFSLALCALLLSLCICQEEFRATAGYVCCCFGRYGLADWRATFVLAELALVASVTCAYAAFTCAAFINFNFLRVELLACTMTTALAVASCMVWAVFGPFTYVRCIARCYDKRMQPMNVQEYSCCCV